VLNDDACYTALESRDPRFDGRFYTGVVTTGIYCRPICPARTPRRRNVRFYASAAAAAEDGFRACRRCRPEAAPGTPARQGTSAAVSRALGLIAVGALDGADVGALAARVGLGERQLRRLFLEHVGASPLAVAGTRRVHLAKKLLDETALPVTEIAFASGFASVRRFNDAVREAFGAAPRELRRGAARRKQAEFELRLAYRPPLDWAGLLDFLRPRAIPGVEQVEADVYRRSVRTPAGVGAIEVRPGDDGRHLLLRAPVSLGRAAGRLSACARRLFDLDADPEPIAAHLRRDPELRKRLRRRPGLRVPGAWDGFELAVRAILGQQVSVAGATTLAGRLVERYGEPLPGAGSAAVSRLFPEPGVLADADVAPLGLPRTRARAIEGLARAVACGELDLSPTEDTEATRSRLLALAGVGPWTAEYVALRALGEPDAFPASDLGLRRALADGSGEAPSEAALASRAEAWRPWRSYAALALWSR